MDLKMNAVINKESLTIAMQFAMQTLVYLILPCSHHLEENAFEVCYE